MYIPNKPAKYGIKIVMVKDVKSKYILSGIHYHGKQGTRSTDGQNLGHSFTKDLTQRYHNTKRNVTTDNWFTSVPLIQDMLHNCGMTLIGIVRGNKSEIAEEMKEKTTRAPGSSAFLFTKDMTLVSYVPNAPSSKKIVLLMSSMHRSAYEEFGSQLGTSTHFSSDSRDLESRMRSLEESSGPVPPSAVTHRIWKAV
ncbi:unnamed protein product [Acanthosepion pharaonis]|uniref:PiggyBac transposable element-derived protein domain-containing protein n=1 Tax=Acanthosepion pharaonis TaxID=158019 RepID=A0A812CAA5_ACAPH|nr:unnamed protein product [Sepia pharaonis]